LDWIVVVVVGCCYAVVAGYYVLGVSSLVFVWIWQEQGCLRRMRRSLRRRRWRFVFFWRSP